MQQPFLFPISLITFVNGNKKCQQMEIFASYKSPTARYLSVVTFVHFQRYFSLKRILWFWMLVGNDMKFAGTHWINFLIVVWVGCDILPHTEVSWRKFFKNWCQNAATVFKIVIWEKIRSIFVFKRKAWNQFKEKLQRDTQKNIEIKKKEPEVEIGHTVCQMINFCPKIQVFHFKAEQKVKIFESVLEHGFQENKYQS